jgi:methylated-DNA-[protein]-cysteine S-methyltransferase
VRKREARRVVTIDNSVGSGLEYTVFNTDMGWVGILGTAAGLRRTTLPRPSAREAHRLLGGSVENAAPSSHHFQDLIERLRAYFAGSRIDFPDMLDLNGATPFQRGVWEATRLIPYGETRSYAWVAAWMGRPGAARAAGQALSRNPLPPVVPCHRVLAGNGGLGGFSGGLAVKKHLLRLENPMRRW